MRKKIINELKNGFEKSSDIIAMWEGGSASFNNIDNYSDIDLQIMSKDDKIDDAVKLAESIMNTISPIGNKLIVPQPSWHGHWQGFYKLKDISPYLIIDLLIMKESAVNRFLEEELHGKPIIYFDKKNIIKTSCMDENKINEDIAGRKIQIKLKTEIFHNFVDKEIARNHGIDAMEFYNAMIIRPLAELIRMKYDKFRYNFGPRYFKRDIPKEIAVRFENLIFIKNIEDLKLKKAQALYWINELLN